MTDTFSKKKTLINDSHILGRIQKCFFCSPFQATMRAEKVFSHFFIDCMLQIEVCTKEKEADPSKVYCSSYLLPDATV